MRKLKLFFIVTVVLSFSVFAQAQQLPDYLFLEVLDSDGKPVADAAVEASRNDSPSLNTDAVGHPVTLKTDAEGIAGFKLPWNLRGFTDSIFKVSKIGYFTFYDLGFSIPHHQYKNSAQLELLKVPQTKKEKRILGSEQLKREFMWAAKTGDAVTVRRLLESGISPNLNTDELRGIPGPKNVSAFTFAANSGSGETIKVFLEAGIDIRVKEEPFRSILPTYLQTDPFFWHKPETDAERREILRRYEDGVEILLKAGADFNIEDSNKRKPIMIAAEKGYARAVKMLLDKEFSTNYMDERGTTLLMYAAGDSYPEIRYSKVETINLLLEKGADPNLSKNGCGSALGGAASRGDVEAIQALLKAGAKINSGCKEVQSPLLWAVEREKVAAAKLLIEAGADKTAVNRDGENALMIAAKKNNAEMVQMLIDKGFPVNKKNNNGLTALMVAVNSFPGSLDAIKILLKAGADPDAIINYENSADCFTSLILSVENRYYNLIKLLSEYKANIDLPCKSGNNALVYALYGYEPEMVKLLIELGANPNGEPIDRAMKLVKTYYKEDSYEGKKISETIKIVEEARAKKEENPK